MADLADGSIQCETTNNYNGLMGVRISSIFVIFIAGSFGALFPLLSSRYSFIRMPNIAFFIAKYFGSGVIVATALIHLLQPANESLSNPCLGPGWQDYPYAFGICLILVFMTFLVDIISSHKMSSEQTAHSHGPVGLLNDHDHNEAQNLGANQSHRGEIAAEEVLEDRDSQEDQGIATRKSPEALEITIENGSSTTLQFDDTSTDNLSTQLGSIFFLEFGILFHSVFIGLTLAVSGDEFKTLYIVLVFHQMFEGLGLGTRIALANWPRKHRWTPWLLSLAFGFTTPIAIAIGLGIRKAYPAGSRTQVMTNGIFDSISAGILLYTGFVELMGHEFLHSHEFKNAKLSRILFAYGVMACGAGLMALLGRWA